MENKVRLRNVEQTCEKSEEKGDTSSQSIREGIGVTPKSLFDVQLCDAFRDPFHSSAGVVIIPTDFISSYYIFSCPGFKQLLKDFDRKITLIAPTWIGDENINVERELLENLNAPAHLDPLLMMIQDSLDTIILPKENILVKDAISTRKGNSSTILVEDLSPTKQCSDDFFQVILKTLDIDRESLRIDSLKERVDLSEKIASSLKGFQKIF
jgi:hypothetical protein